MSSYRGWNLTAAEREKYRNISKASSQAKAKAMRGEGLDPVHEINQPKLNPEDLMPQLPKNGLRSLSLFSGGGGLDLGFERAGFQHIASYEVLEDAGKTLQHNRSHWTVFSSDAGDVRNVDWTQYRGEVDVIHGGPPCQPFSVAGRQEGQKDDRDMFPEFVRAILEVSPRAFVAENVSALSSKKFNNYVFNEIQKPLLNRYNVLEVVLYAPDFGIPQSRKRVFFIGFQDKRSLQKFIKPQPIYDWQHLNTKNNHSKRDPNSLQLNLFEREASTLNSCLGVREALGLPNIGFDALAPTLRSGLTGPRHTTSILNSSSAQTLWRKLQIWPNGVAETRENARLFVAKNKHFRLSIPDCAILQGFPESWQFCGAVYMALGQIGNAVPPPLGYHVARSIERALS